jgi:hypothetical protein
MSAIRHLDKVKPPEQRKAEQGEGINNLEGYYENLM